MNSVFVSHVLHCFPWFKEAEFDDIVKCYKTLEPIIISIGTREEQAISAYYTLERLSRSSAAERSDFVEKIRLEYGSEAINEIGPECSAVVEPVAEYSLSDAEAEEPTQEERIEEIELAPEEDDEVQQISLQVPPSHPRDKCDSLEPLTPESESKKPSRRQRKNAKWKSNSAKKAAADFVFVRENKDPIPRHHYLRSVVDPTLRGIDSRHPMRRHLLSSKHARVKKKVKDELDFRNGLVTNAIIDLCVHGTIPPDFPDEMIGLEFLLLSLNVDGRSSDPGPSPAVRRFHRHLLT